MSDDADLLSSWSEDMATIPEIIAAETGELPRPNGLRATTEVRDGVKVYSLVYFFENGESKFLGDVPAPLDESGEPVEIDDAFAAQFAADAQQVADAEIARRALIQKNLDKLNAAMAKG